MNCDEIRKIRMQTLLQPATLVCRTSVVNDDDFHAMSGRKRPGGEKRFDRNTSQISPTMLGDDDGNIGTVIVLESNRVCLSSEIRSRSPERDQLRRNDFEHIPSEFAVPENASFLSVRLS